jgi:chromosome segregation ATPase
MTQHMEHEQYSEDNMSAPGSPPISPNSDNDNESSSDKSVRRKIKNREAQRAYRKRQINYIKTLENKVALLESTARDRIEQLHRERQALWEEIKMLQKENQDLKNEINLDDAKQRSQVRRPYY